ncbi:MAG: segregation and condensation protein A [[Eubacterium] siraeum]
MQELKFKLEVYEGPLDLMLSLIAKHKLNIYDIEISLLLEQFMLYLDRMKQADIEIAGEFLEMAARLIYIKSAALLPKHEAEEMKKELQGVLIEYAMCKQIALQLQQSWVGDDVFVRPPGRWKKTGISRHTRAGRAFSGNVELKLQGCGTKSRASCKACHRKELCQRIHKDSICVEAYK